MLTQLIWLASLALEIAVVIRAIQTRLVRFYLGFYCYIVSVLAIGIARMLVLEVRPAAYAWVYWDTQFVSLIAGCIVIFEIYRIGLEAFPGTARMARNLLLVVFGLVFAKALATGNEGATAWWSALTAVKLERDLRIVQTGALLALIAVFLVYSIPLSRNLRGIVLGYGLFLSTSVVQLTLMVGLDGNFAKLWSYLRPLAYVLVLVVWAVTLWSYQEAPKPAHAITLDDDYNMLVASTRRKFQKTRLALGKVVRP